ncbi:hypothetical protein EVAR_32865_1 [Eumeta japonica]|uniref:Uncharacterized protein n=1 Tax=Eumeta variegata TaxID=151549 RepID=A0A4C1WBN5_EUMVA|nr:hypothetical protein EVAR_32865_1 [Eumeta japonica]
MGALRIPGAMRAHDRRDTGSLHADGGRILFTAALPPPRHPAAPSRPIKPSRHEDKPPPTCGGLFYLTLPA